MINRYLAGDRVPPRLIWEQVKGPLDVTAASYVVFNDRVLDKRYARKIALVRRQYSGNAKGVIHGIGVVTCVYVQSEQDRFWLIDYRIYDPQGDGKTKLDHVLDMLSGLVYQKDVPFPVLLMDRWYATKKGMLHIEQSKKTYYCPLKSNRLVDDASGQPPYQRVDGRTWTAQERQGGKPIKLRGFPKDHKVTLFPVASATGRTEHVATNDQKSVDTFPLSCKLSRMLGGCL